jgi:hypothetical protein
VNVASCSYIRVSYIRYVILCAPFGWYNLIFTKILEKHTALLNWLTLLISVILLQLVPCTIPTGLRHRRFVSVDIIQALPICAIAGGTKLVLHIYIFFNPLLFASCTDTVKLLEAWRGVLSSTPPYKYV